MTQHAYIFGHPIKHTLSPAMHGAAFAELGIDARYDPLDVPPGDLGLALARLRQPGVLGANVTVPHKQAALPHLDEVESSAAEIGAINTVVNCDGRLVGHNTDASGFLAALAEADFAPRGARVALIGAGGAARAIASALAESNVGELLIFNRDRQRALDLARDLVVRFGARPYFGVPLEASFVKEHLPQADLLVNATTVGLEGEAPAVSLADLRSTMLVVDIIYNPARTPLLAAAEAVGARTQNGLPMLVHQAAAAFELWTGQPAPVATMRFAAESALRVGV